MAYPEACDKREAAARIAVNHPEQLSRDPWAAHLRECPECRDTVADMSRTLAVFRQVELDRLAQRTEYGPSWDQLAIAMRGQPRYLRIIRRYRAPVAAAAVGGMLLFTGASLWLSDPGAPQDSPARIVKLEPDQQKKMQQVVRQSLADSVNTTPAVLVPPAPQLAPAEPIAAEEVASEPAGLYASGDRLPATQPAFRRNHPFLDRGDMTTVVEDTAGPRATYPTFPVMSGAGSSAVTFPVYRPNAR